MESGCLVKAASHGSVDQRCVLMAAVYAGSIEIGVA